MSDPKVRFLEAEEQAGRLLEQLQKLKSSMDDHEDAATSLREGSGAVRALAAETAEAARAVSALVTQLGDIGTPEILESINEGRAQTSRVVRLAWVGLGLGVAILLGLLAVIGLLLNASA
jgi:hypothetical protein